MKSQEVEIGGITYKVSATTQSGLESAISQLRASLEPKPKKKKKNQDDV